MSHAPETVGLVGLGLMGSAFAARLRQHGHPVVGFDIRPEAVSALETLGGQGAATAGEVVARCGLVILSLPTDREARAVLADTAPHFRPGMIVIDSTTGDPDSPAGVARELSSRGVAYLDGTVSGNSEQARVGEVVWMVGGEREALDRCIAVLRELGREVIHTGPAGSGARMKLVSNLVLGLNRAALAEGLAFAEALGLDAAASLRVLRAGAAQSRVMDVKGEKMVRGEYKPQARLKQHLKDVRLIRGAAAAAGMDLPLSAAHEALLERAVELGLGEMDNSAVIETIRGRSRPARGESPPPPRPDDETVMS